MSSNNRVFQFDFIRSISTIMIIVFHFIIQERVIYFWPTGANFSLGELGVALFFILSGASLMNAYRNDFNIKKYFKKRFLAIYPMFWIAYSCAFLYDFYMGKGINESISFVKILLSVIGMDGYLMYKIPVFYLLGEWFLGAIIIFYILFPFLLYLIKKSWLITSIVVMFIYLYLCFNYTFEIFPDRNTLINLPLFLFGMLFSKNIIVSKDRIKQLDFKLILVSLLIFMVYFLFSKNLKIPHQVLFPSISIFLILWYFSNYIKNRYLINFVNQISVYSYAIFLVHHRIEYSIAAYFMDTNLSLLEMWLLFIVYLIKIAIFAKLLIITKEHIFDKHCIL